MKIRYLALVALAATGMAEAAIIPTLTSIDDMGSDYQFNYRVRLAGDQGMTPATGGVPTSSFVIFDFAGYVDGSAYVGGGLPFSVAVENVTSGYVTVPGEVDDPDLVNLVFTFTGQPYNVSGGPFDPTYFEFVGARSTFGDFALSSYSSIGVTNSGIGTEGTVAYNQGSVATPFGTDSAIPEPATWGLLLTGFGMAGAALRRRKSSMPVTLA